MIPQPSNLSSRFSHFRRLIHRVERIIHTFELVIHRSDLFSGKIPQKISTFSPILSTVPGMVFHRIGLFFHRCVPFSTGFPSCYPQPRWKIAGIRVVYPQADAHFIHNFPGFIHWKRAFLHLGGKRFACFSGDSPQLFSIYAPFLWGYPQPFADFLGVLPQTMPAFLPVFQQLSTKFTGLSTACDLNRFVSRRQLHRGPPAPPRRRGKTFLWYTNACIRVF